MNTKRRSKISVFVVFATLIAALCVACGDGDNGSRRRLVSYTAVDTPVQSTTADVVRKIADTVVEIKTNTVITQWGMQYVVSGAGSGVIVAHDEAFETYYIVTNNHVIDGANEIKVTLHSGEMYTAALVATDARDDIAVVSIKETSTLNVAIWGNSDSLQIGEDLIAIGNPLGSLGGTVTKGILSATKRFIPVGDYTMELLQTDTAINPGNSGGGLFNMRGNLIGIVNAKTTDEEVEGICFAIPSNTAKAIFEDLVENGVVIGRATIGVEVAYGSNGTVYVKNVIDAESGTFEQYDKIAEINGNAITSLLTYNDAIGAIKPDDEVKVKVYRGQLVQNKYGSGISFSSEPTEFTVTAKQLAK
ncbi:MAG: trypsin-like peptidase domain-containing protein [Clostridiales bacterium]|nr:trypsin-like peptidase domain-containing protein [Clostridiales bacterium]